MWQDFGSFKTDWNLQALWSGKLEKKVKKSIYSINNNICDCYISFYLWNYIHFNRGIGLILLSLYFWTSIRETLCSITCIKYSSFYYAFLEISLKEGLVKITVSYVKSNWYLKLTLLRKSMQLQEKDEKGKLLHTTSTRQLYFMPAFDMWKRKIH